MEQRMTGTFYGVSVGPGDPELLTLQAVRLLRQCPVLAAPQTASGQMLALDIARRALGAELDGKTILPLQFAMSRADEVLDAPGTKVLMKTGRQLPALLDTLDAHGALSRSALVCSCGLPDETVFPDLSTARPPQDGSKAGYFATVLVKE